MNLELHAMEWLRFEKRCPVVIRERTPRWGMGEPDVIGATCARYLLEIEIKRSASDFRADLDKRHVRDFQEYANRMPKHKWYLVPNDLTPKVAHLVPEWAGLLEVSKFGVMHCVKPAPANPKSPRLSFRECVKLSHQMANHIISVERALDNFKGLYRPRETQTEYEI